MNSIRKIFLPLNCYFSKAPKKMHFLCPFFHPGKCSICEEKCSWSQDKKVGNRLLFFLWRQLNQLILNKICKNGKINKNIFSKTFEVKINDVVFSRRLGDELILRNKTAVLQFRPETVDNPECSPSEFSHK